MLDQTVDSIEALQQIIEMDRQMKAAIARRVGDGSRATKRKKSLKFAVEILEYLFEITKEDEEVHSLENKKHSKKLKERKSQSGMHSQRLNKKYKIHQHREKEVEKKDKKFRKHGSPPLIKKQQSAGIYNDGSSYLKLEPSLFNNEALQLIDKSYLPINSIFKRKEEEKKPKKVSVNKAKREQQKVNPRFKKGRL